MKPLKLTGFYKLACFLLIAILILVVLGFAVGGMQDNANLPDSGDVVDKNDKTDENNDGSGNTDQNGNTDNSDNNNENNPDSDDQEIPEEPPQPIYYNAITGLEISAEKLNATPIGIVLNPSNPLYGISDSELAIEFPTENGNTRMLSYTTDVSDLWKIGSLAPSRAFISSMSALFGGIVVYYGNDDIVIYDAWEKDSIVLDVSKVKQSYYIENTVYIYTNSSLIDVGKEQSGLASVENPYKESPFAFVDGAENITWTGSAQTVILPFSDHNETEFYYHKGSGQYLFYKSANRKIDMLNGKNISFKNIFVLLSDSTTYEKAEGTELVIDILSGGSGYYISEGNYLEFKWQVDKAGKISFIALNGEKLKINRGNSYISFYKASKISDIVII